MRVCESVCSRAETAAQSDAFTSHGSDHRPSASSSAPPALEQSVLFNHLSCRDGSGEIKQDFKELVHDHLHCGFLMPLASRLRPWTRPEDTSSHGAYLTYNSVDSFVRANTGARFRSSLNSMPHSLCIVLPEWHRADCGHSPSKSKFDAGHHMHTSLVPERSSMYPAFLPASCIDSQTQQHPCGQELGCSTTRAKARMHFCLLSNPCAVA